MIGQDKLAEERKQLVINGKARIQELAGAVSHIHLAHKRGMLALALLACGESLARAQDPPLKIPEPPSKPEPPEPLAAFDVVRAAWGGFEPYDPADAPPPTQPKSKPRSKSGQRRAHARWGR